MNAIYGVLPQGPGPSPHYIWSESSLGFAFVEGWAEFMECAVDNAPANLQGWYGGHGGNIETNDWSNCVDTGDMDGDIVEGSVASIFWDIMDPSNDDPMTRPFADIFHIIQCHKPNDIDAFWSQWSSHYTELVKLSAIYWAYGIRTTDQSTQLAFTLSTNPASPGAMVTLSGALRDAVNNPVYPAEVKVEYSASGGTTWNLAWTLNTNSAGAFYITFAAPGVGTYLVRVSYAGSAVFRPSRYTQTLTVQTDKVNTQITFTLSLNPASPGIPVTLSGTLKDTNGNPVYQAQVKVYYSTNGGASWNYIWTLNTNTAGQFSRAFTAPRAGTYLVGVSYAGSASYNPSSQK